MRGRLGLILIWVGLVFLVINLAPLAYSPSHQVLHSTHCASFIMDAINSSMPKNIDGRVEGSGYFVYDNITLINEWVRLNGCKIKSHNISFYTDIYEREGKKGNISIILLHDYGSNRSSLYSVAEYLAAKNFNVILPDLPGAGRNKDFPPGSLVAKNIVDSYWYRSLCMINVLTKYAYSYLNARAVYVMGVSSGGTLALLAGDIVNGVNGSISIGAIGNFTYNIDKASLLNFVVEKTTAECSDPFQILRSSGTINSSNILLIGTNDEYTFPDSLATYPSVEVVVRLNADHISLIPNWRTTVMRLLNDVISGKSIRGRSISVWRPLLPGAPWSRGDGSPASYFLPVMVIKGYSSNLGRDFILYNGICIKYSLSGLLLSIIMVILGFLLSYTHIHKEYELSWADNIYIIALTIVVFIPILPSIYVPGRFHISMYEFTDRLYPLLPLIGQLVTLSIFLEPLLLALLLHRGGRGLFYLYASYPIFNVVSLVSFILIIGWKYHALLPVFPTWGLVIPLIVIITDYILASEEPPPHEEASSQA